MSDVLDWQEGAGSHVESVEKEADIHKSILSWRLQRMIAALNIANSGGKQQKISARNARSSRAILK